MKNNEDTLSKQIYQEFKQNIEQHHYLVGQKLPSIRTLASKRKISTTTVLTAYNQLVLEGYVKSVERSGYIVKPLPTIPTTSNPTSAFTHDFSPGKNKTLDEELFDVKTMKSMTNKVYNYHQHDLLSPADPFGEEMLRDQIQKYVLKERGVTCHKDQIIIAPGVQFLLEILLSIVNKSTLLTTPNEFQKAMTIFQKHQIKIHHTKTFKEMPKYDFLYISPSNVYPTGEVIQMDDRINIINWANESDAYIIEDDYNYFMRYNAFSVPSIQSLDHQERVIYIGSFSKVLFPGLKISFMVLPIHLIKKAEQSMKYHTQGVSKIDQLAMANFMSEGLFYRHTKKLFSSYKEKNSVLMKTIKQLQIEQLCKVTSTTSNLHIVLTFYDKKDKDLFINQCNVHDYNYQITHQENTIIFPYEGIKNEEMYAVFSALFTFNK
ncbi:MAG: MocR-like pyridoxine biosynthesis transcription factor PdxR [Candidatus Izemoplasmataceae bacterium]